MANVRRLPVELLLEIFSQVVFSKSAATLKIWNKSNVFGPSLTLSHVSHHWRTIASSCPRLWSSIFIDVDRPRSRFDAILSTYIKNSADCPLAITIIGPGPSNRRGNHYRPDCLGANGMVILDRILSHSSRIETLQFFRFDLDIGLPDDLQYVFPLLRRFETNMPFWKLDSSLAKSLEAASLLDTASAQFTDEIPPSPTAS
ncbi:hypothetical protein L218DRAFT_1058724 [Marasmius fiardii PR-910]|nr:hypothetical protein L218DRAFT_1058724 [Marasmius fiardii PR-910]